MLIDADRIKFDCNIARTAVGNNLRTIHIKSSPKEGKLFIDQNSYIIQW